MVLIFTLCVPPRHSPAKTETGNTVRKALNRLKRRKRVLMLVIHGVRERRKILLNRSSLYCQIRWTNDLKIMH